jgi:hypothetical protein
VLLGDAHLLPRPTLSELVQVGHQGVPDRDLEPVVPQQPVEDRVGILFVECLQGRAQIEGELEGRRERIAGVVHPRHLAGRFGGRKPRAELFLHQTNAALIGR